MNKDKNQYLCKIGQVYKKKINGKSIGNQNETKQKTDKQQITKFKTWQLQNQNERKWKPTKQKRRASSVKSW